MTEIRPNEPDTNLLAWTRTVLHQPQISLEPAAGDASSRAYHRVRGLPDAALMAMSAPDQEDGVERYLDVGRRLADAGVQVPRIEAVDQRRGYLIITDLGSVHYLDMLDGKNADALYGRALNVLLRIQRGVPAHDLPPYDEALLRRELEIFHEWFLGVHRRRQLDPAETARWRRCCDLLVENARRQPVCFVHRDYHSRNLMWREGGDPGVLDFQDAVRGPVTYDLASLLLDCYIAWPRDQVRAWALQYRDRMAAAGLIEPMTDDLFLRRLHLMATQRHLKAIGIFARLFHRDGKPGYLADIPRTAAYIRVSALEYPELEPLVPLLDSPAVTATAGPPR